MKEMDCVEVIVEKEKYAKKGVHKGMQGWICYDKKVRGHAIINEQIKAQFEALEKDLRS